MENNIVNQLEQPPTDGWPTALRHDYTSPYEATQTPRAQGPSPSGPSRAIGRRCTTPPLLCGRARNWLSREEKRRRTDSVHWGR